MEFERIQPPGYLQDYIQYGWTLESNGIDLFPKVLGPLADGCPGLIFQPLEAGIFYDQYHQPLPELFLYGQTVARTKLCLIGQFKTVGICFYPHALKSVVGFDASELTDACLDLHILSADLPDQLLSTPSLANQLEILSAWLFAQIGKTGTPVDAATQDALIRIIQSKGRLSLKELQKNLNLSERSLERKFNQYVGISPKLFSRVCQFQASLNQLKRNGYARLSDVAYDNGYADQSHFIRTFKTFAGFPPCQLQKRAYQVVEDFSVLIK